MRRLAREQDVEQIIQYMLELRHQTDWMKFNREGYNHDTLRAFIVTRLLDPCSVCYVWDAGCDGIRAFCGASLTRFYLPPCMPIVCEWGWSGEPKYAAACWRGVVRWGKRHGAELAQRSTQHQTPGRHITEQVTWEVL